jgi:hypothetical protein
MPMCCGSACSSEGASGSLVACDLPFCNPRFVHSQVFTINNTECPLITDRALHGGRCPLHACCRWDEIIDSFGEAGSRRGGTVSVVWLRGACFSAAHVFARDP